MRRVGTHIRIGMIVILHNVMLSQSCHPFNPLNPSSDRAKRAPTGHGGGDSGFVANALVCLPDGYLSTPSPIRHEFDYDERKRSMLPRFSVILLTAVLCVGLNLPRRAMSSDSHHNAPAAGAPASAAYSLPKNL